MSVYIYIYIYTLAWTCAYPCTEQRGPNHIVTLQSCCQSAVCHWCFVLCLHLEADFMEADLMEADLIEADLMEANRISFQWPEGSLG